MIFNLTKLGGSKLVVIQGVNGGKWMRKLHIPITHVLFIGIYYIHDARYAIYQYTYGI